MSIKEEMLRRIEKDSIKVNVGKENVYLKKSGAMKEWHVIYPPVDLESVEKATGDDGKVDYKKVKWNYLNLIFGGKANALKTLGVVIIVGLLIFGMKEIITSYSVIINNPIVQSCLRQAGMVLG